MRKTKKSSKTHKCYFKESLLYIKDIKNYIYFTTTLFLLTAIIGFIFPNYFEEQILNFIRQLLELTKDMTAFELVEFITINNIRSSFMAMFFGIILGIVPFAVTIVNGYILGFVAHKTIAVEGIFTLWKLFPHGIFELPAIMISIAMGFKLGLFPFTSKEKNKKKEFWNYLKLSLTTFILIILPLLIIAGIIEGILLYVLR